MTSEAKFGTPAPGNGAGVFAWAKVTDWDDAYANRAHIPDAERIIAHWAEAAPAFRAQARARLDLPYGPGERERFDLFLPEGEPRGLAVFVHGGYWMAFGRETWSHLAAGPVARGWAVALPSYALAPGARVSEMTRQMAAFLPAAAAEVAGPIALAGHSAGGHLISRLLCTGVLPGAVAGRIARGVSISGLHDLRPLWRTAMNETLRLDEAEAAAESAALLAPAEGARLLAWVGGDERPEFIRQSALIAQAWGGVAETALVVEPDRHHFDVIAGLERPDSPLTEALLGW